MGGGKLLGRWEEKRMGEDIVMQRWVVSRSTAAMYESNAA